MKVKMILQRMAAWALLILLLLPGNVHAEPEGILQRRESFNPDYEYYLQHPEEFTYGYVPPKARFDLKDEAEEPMRTLPSSYDARTLGRISPVKDQGRTGTCWAHAASSSVETAWKSLRNNFLNLSEMHMAYNAEPGTDLNTGGNALIAMSYYARLDGPVLETDYSTVNDVQVVNDEAILPGRTKMEDYEAMRGGFAVGELIAIPFGRIRQYVMDYGMVMSSYRVIDGASYYTHDSQHHQPGLGYHLPGGLQPNHAISIVGWDDNRTIRNNRGERATGAFLVKNSWGTDFGEDGYFWISYDTFPHDGHSYVFTDVGEQFDRVYRAEAYEWQGESMRIPGSSRLYVMNEYERRTTGEEEAKEVGFYKFGDDPTTYTFWLGQPNAVRPETYDFEEVASRTLEHGGYFTVPLRAVRLKGSRFAIKVKAETLNNKDLFFTVETPYYNQGFLKSSYSQSDTRYSNTDGKVPILTLFTKRASQPVQDIQEALVEGVRSQDYIGAEIRPKVKVLLFGMPLKEFTDYTVTYEDNIEPGRARIRIRGIGNYRGEIVRTFEIRDYGIRYREWQTKTRVSRTKRWTVKFNRPVNRDRLADYILLFHESDTVNPLSLNLRLSPDGREATLIPHKKFLPGGKYYLVIREVETPEGKKLKENIRMCFIVEE